MQSRLIRGQIFPRAILYACRQQGRGEGRGERGGGRGEGRGEGGGERGEGRGEGRGGRGEGRGERGEGRGGEDIGIYGGGVTYLYCRVVKESSLCKYSHQRHLAGGREGGREEEDQSSGFACIHILPFQTVSILCPDQSTPQRRRV